MSRSVVLGEPDPVVADAVAVILDRCVPWVTLRVGDTLSDGYRGWWQPDGGTAGCVLVATDHGLCDALDTAHHEVWHAVEGWLTPSALVSVVEMAAGGQSYADAYLDASSEQCARLYASLARAWDSGLRMSVGTGDRAVAVMWAVYTGGVAADVVAARALSSRLPLPERGRLRRALVRALSSL